MRGKVREEQAESRRPPRDPSQRRFDRIFAVTFIAAMAILATVLGVILPRLREGRQPSPNGTSKQALKAEVERAYLAYWDAIEEAYLKLDASLLEKVMISDALEEERKAIERERQQGRPVREEAMHNYKIVVYRGGQLASVDDIYILHRVPLDPQTLQPIGPDPELLFHDSFTLSRVDGHWKVGEDIIFGSGRPLQGRSVSQAAASLEDPVPENLRKEIEQAYLDYWSASAEAYRKLDPAPLKRVLMGAALEKDLTFLNDQRQKNERFLIDVEHNYRIAVNGNELAYVYDTVADRSVFINGATGKPVERRRTDIFRFSYNLRKVEGRWKVDLVERHE